MKTAAASAILPAQRPLRGRVRVPGDKSVSHRAALIAAVAQGRSSISGFSAAGDCASTLDAVRGLGVRVERSGDDVTIEGAGWDGARATSAEIDCGRSGTTMRLLCGIVAASGLDATLTGDAQLMARPMERVAEPLRRMGARVETADGRPPIHVIGASLSGIEYEPPVASAQVKSAVLLAGLRAEGTTTIVEPTATRDHTERLLAWLGAPIELGESRVRRISVRSFEPSGFAVSVPGDVSSAAPLLAAAAVVPASDVVLEGVGLNPTRDAYLGLLERMGCQLDVVPRDAAGPEPSGDVRIRSAPLRAVRVGSDDVPSMIDELPLVGVLGALAEGTTEVRGAAELRVKESDRIAVLVAGLRALGAEAEELPDGFVVHGPTPFHEAALDTAGDHRLGMAFAVAALASSGPVAIAGLEAVADSFPSFVDTLGSLR